MDDTDDGHTGCRNRQAGQIRAGTQPACHIKGQVHWAPALFDWVADRCRGSAVSEGIAELCNGLCGQVSMRLSHIHAGNATAFQFLRIIAGMHEGFAHVCIKRPEIGLLEGLAVPLH